MFGFFPKKVSNLKHPSPLLLPEDVKYALKYKDGNLDDKLVLQILREEYKMLGVGLGLKYVQQLGGDQYARCLQQVLQALYEAPQDFERPLLVLRDTIQASKLKGKAIDGYKATLLSQSGFDLGPRFEDVAKTWSRDVSAFTPVFIAGSAIYAITPFLNQMENGSNFYLMFSPKRFEDGVLYRISVSDGGIRVNVADSDEILGEVKLIDDCVHTGDTLRLSASKLKAQQNFVGDVGYFVAKKFSNQENP